jgi:predicted ribosome quality control (RQC) complex YloA/Tae2 family protein
MGAGEIAAVVAELQPLVGARVDDLWVPAERSVLLELHRKEGAVLVAVSAEADLCRIHAASARPAAGEEPPPFQVILRRALKGSRLAGLDCARDDRVVHLRFEGRAGARALVAELTGRHGNLFLLDEVGAILGSAGRNLSTRRALLPGRPYQPPAPRARPAGALRGGEAAARTRSGGHAEDRFRVDDGNRFGGGATSAFPISAAVEAWYQPREAERRLEEARRRLREPVHAGVARSRRALEKLEAEAARVPRAEADRRAADLIKQHLHAIDRGVRSATLTEYRESGPVEVTVSLDPALTPRQNMERYYRHYRRIVDSATRVEARAAEVRGRLANLEALERRIAGAGPDALLGLEKEARRLGAGPRAAPKPQRRRETPRVPYRLFQSLGGGPILVGRNAAGNDELTLKVAKGNDLWLHARGQPGSHVVLRLEKGAGPKQEGLLDAAHLAVHFSDARGERSCEVTYTRAKHVKKPKGSPPGLVTVTQEKTILLRLEPDRLQRLLEGEEES